MLTADLILYQIFYHCILNLICTASQVSLELGVCESLGTSHLMKLNPAIDNRNNIHLTNDHNHVEIKCILYKTIVTIDCYLRYSFKYDFNMLDCQSQVAQL